jgi:hypothetical protein
VPCAGGRELGFPPVSGLPCESVANNYWPNQEPFWVRCGSFRMRDLASVEVGGEEPSFPGWVFLGQMSRKDEVVRVVVLSVKSEKRDIGEL